MDVARLRVIIEGSAEGAQRALGQAESAFRSTAGKLTSAGTAMTAGVTVPLVGSAALIAKGFGEYERNASVFQATTGATTAEMEKMRATAKALGGDITLPGTSAGDAAAAMLELAKGGLSVQQAMDGATGVLQLSAAAQIDNAEAATIVADALNTFGLAGADAARVSDLLAATANASTAEITDVAYGFQMAGAVFASNKVPIEDLSTSLGILANAGIKGSDAGTSLKTMMMRLAAPTDEASKAMQALGIQAYNADGSMRPFRDIIGQLSSATSGLSDEQRNAALETIFGADAIRAATILAGAGAEGFDKMAGAVTKQGAAADLAKAQNNGLLGAWDGLVSVIETIGISIGEAFGPSITNALKVVAGWAEKLGAFFEALPAPVKNVIGIVAAVAAIAGPALLVVGGLMSAAATIGSVLAAIASPVGLVVLAIGGLVAAFAILWAKSEGFRDFVLSLWDAMQPGLQRAWEGVQSIIQTVRDFIDSVVTKVKEWLAENKDTVEEWKTTLRQVFADVGQLVGDVVDYFKVVFETIKRFWDEWGDEILQVVSGAITQVISFIKGAVSIIRGIVETITGLLSGDPEKIKQGLGKVVSGIKDVLLAPVKGIVTMLGGHWKDITDAVGRMPGNIARAASGMWDGIKNAFKSAINWIIDRWNGLEFKVPSFTAFGRTMGGFTLGVPDIPRLAAGGLVPGSATGVLATIGEGGRGRDEAVLPLNSAVFGRIGEGIARAGGGGVTVAPTYNLTINGGGTELLDEVRRIIDDANRDLVLAVRAQGA